MLRTVKKLHRPAGLELTLALVTLAALLCGAAWFYVQRAQRASIQPTTADFSKAEKILDREMVPGDGFAILPGWSAGQRWRFRRVWRDKGQRFDAAMIFGDPLSAWDTDGHQRVWVLATHGQHPRLQAGQPEHIGRTGASYELSAGTVLTRLDMPPSRTVFDFMERLSDAEVRRVDAKGNEERCRWVADRQRCSGQWWRSVKAGLHEVGGTRRRCMFVQPHPDKGTLRMTYSDLPVAHALHARFGNQLWAVRYDEGSDVTLRVLIGDKVRLELAVHRGDFRWHALRVQLDAADAGKAVTFEISAEDATWRQACLDARLLGPKVPQ